MEDPGVSELTYQCVEFSLRPYYLSAFTFHFVGISIALTGFLVASLPTFNRR